MDRKKIRKPLSILLVFAMISSLFTGTAIAKVREGAGKLFDKKITVLITQGEGQIAQRFKIATGSEANLASASVAIKTATGSEANLAEAEVDESTKEIIITPLSTASPSNATVTMTVDSNEINGQAEFRYNWFYDSSAEIASDQESVTINRANGVNDSNIQVIIQNEDGTTATDGVINKQLNTSGDAVVLTRTGTVAQEKTYRLVVVSNETTIGICMVTVMPKEGGNDEPKQLSVFTTDNETVAKNAKNWKLPLTENAKAIEDKLTYDVNGTSVKFASDGSLEVVEPGDSTITATFKSADDKGGYDELINATYKVTVSTKVQVNFFNSATKEVTLRNGATYELPLTASASEAYKADKADIISSDNNVASVIKTNPEQLLVKAGKPTNKAQAVITFTVGEEYDEFVVNVEPVGKTELFKLTEEEKANGVTLTVGEDRTMALTTKAEELLEDEDIEVEVLSDDNSVLTAEFGPNGSLVFTGKSTGEAEVTLKIGSAVDYCKVLVNDYSEKLDDILDKVTDNMTETDIKNTVSALESVTSEMAKNDPEYFNKLAQEDPDQVDAYMEKISLLEKQIREKFQVSTEAAVESEIVEHIDIIGLALNADLAKIGQKVKLAIADTRRPPKVGEDKISKAAVALNIELQVDESKVNVKSPIKVTMNAPLDAEELMIYHIHGNEVTKSRVEVVDGMITFYITRLSTFVFDYADPEDVTEPDDTPDYTGSSSRGGSGGGFSSNKAARNLYAMSGNWEQVGASWKFKKLNGYYAKNEWGYINNSYYYFGDDQLMKTGWQYISNAWYYLNPAAGSEEGKMLTGWQQINGSLYYLNTSGAMAADQYVDGYYVNASGARVQ